MFKISLSFLCNFKPSILVKKKNLKKRIFCKNFIIFLMFLSLNKELNSSIFIKPYRKKKYFSILKAPHRFKKSKHLLCFTRYEVLLSLKFIDFQNTINDFVKIPALFRSLNKIFSKIDSSICTQKTKSFLFKGRFINQFTYSN